MTVVEVLVAAALLTGSAFALLAAVGLHRFTTVFTRLHAATKLMTLGLILIVGATAARLPDAGDRAKLVLVILLQMLTAPVGAHLVGRTAYRAGTELGPVTVDELGDAPPGDET